MEWEQEKVIETKVSSDKMAIKKGVEKAINEQLLNHFVYEMDIILNKFQCSLWDRAK